MRPATLKSCGYLVSTLSVVLLGIVSWKAASGNAWLMAALLLGMAASILGMGLRWRSYEIEEREEN